MASNMLPGDRRWGQTRKSGMTVLGKVPKPINLPSQRLENHGLDPNVEIVPKGTLTWGSRPSLTTPNAWASSSLSSPKTDGSTASPSGLSGCPSSGGSFTRPSTAASDRSHQAVSNVWGPNSRPSSASGILPLNQTSAAMTRPRSAETRSGSSQLSCFTEPIAESSAWGATRIAEKLVPTSKSNSFTLSSGDFPTLGSEKNFKSNVAQQGHSSQGRPASASGRVAVQKETVEPISAGNQMIVPCLDKGNVDTWRRDDSPYTGSTVPPSSDNSYRDQLQTQPYPHANVPSHQFDSWQGPPVQSPPDRIWYRGGSPGGLYRPGGPAGGYPPETYHYYPQPPARPLSNSQVGPRQGAVGGGYGPVSGGSHHPHTPDSYMVPNRPVCPLRPEVYPHQVHYEGYYGHPTFGNANEQEGPVLGIATCRSLSSQHANPNSNIDPGNLNTVPCYFAPSVISEQVEDGHARESHEPQYKVLLKQHDGYKHNDLELNKDQSLTESVAHLEIKDRSGTSAPVQNKGGKYEPAKMGLDFFQHCKGSETHSSVSTVQKNAAIPVKSETLDDHCASEGEDTLRYSVKRSSTLIEKIESLNNKARLADGRSLVPAFAGEEKKRQFKNVTTKVDPTKVNAGTTLSENSSAENVSVDGDMEKKVKTGDTNLESTVDVKVQLRASETHASAVGSLGSSDVGLAAHSQTHKKLQSKQSRADNHTKSKVNGQDGEERRKTSPGRDSSVSNMMENHFEPKLQDCQPCQDASEEKELHHMIVGDEPHFASSMDQVDYGAQRDKLKEIARQRAKQLQKEEEERTREQKARALVKLEELNRRMLTESSNQMVHHAPSFDPQSGQDGGAHPAIKTIAAAIEAQNLNSGPTNAVVQKAKDVSLLEESVNSSSRAVSISFVHNVISKSPMQDVVKTEGKADSQSHDGSLSKQKLMPNKREDSYSDEKHVFEKKASVGVMVGSIIVGSKDLGESVLPSSSTSDGTPSNKKDVDEPSMQQKKRSNRTTRNRSKLDEVPLGTIVQSAQKVLRNVTTEDCKHKPSESAVEATPDPPETSNGVVGGKPSSDIATVSSNQALSQGTTGVPGKAAVQWKPQPSRRVTRNSQATKSVDKFHGIEAVVWAPVRSNKKESSEEVQNVTSKVDPHSSGKNESNVELNLKSMRTEIERYVLKPIAKESAQPENPQQSAASHHHATSSLKVELVSHSATDIGGPDHSSTAKVGVLADAKNGENLKSNKHGRTHTSWRRRGPLESSLPFSSLPEGPSSDSNKNIENISCSQQPPKHDDQQKEQSKFCDDGWNDDNNYPMQCQPTTAPPVEKDHTKMNRGRRQLLKGHKAAGNSSSSRDNWEPVHGRAEKASNQMMTTEVDESAGRRGTRNENLRASDHPRSQWQPKSQASSTPNHCQEPTGDREQKLVPQVNRFFKESSVPEGGTDDQPVESASIAIAVSAERSARQHEEKRERRMTEESFRRPNLVVKPESSTVPEIAPENAEAQHELVSSGTHRRGQRSGWYARGHETSFGGPSPGQDTGKPNLSVSVDRRKQYQRTGYYDKQNDSVQQSSAVGDEAQDSSKSVGKYRERGHNYPRRGAHFYIRNRTSDAYGNGE